MSDVDGIKRQGHVTAEHDVVQIANHFGLFNPYALIGFNERKYALGGLTSEAKEQPFPFGLAVYEYSKGTAFVFLDDGRIFRHDLEDEKVGMVEEKLVFYSDAGLSVFSKEGQISCIFNDLGEYIIDINFGAIEETGIRFILGDSRELVFSVNEIVERIGNETLENLVKNSPA